MRLALAALVLFLGVAVAASAAPTARPSCVVQGRQWRSYDVHPGQKGARLTGTGRLYSVVGMAVSCASAKAALAKMFPRMRRASYNGSYIITGGPKGFVCRSQIAIRPDISFGGECANLKAHKLFSWIRYDPKHYP